MHEIEFGNPNLHHARFARQYGLDSVAFVKGYEKTVAFQFFSQVKGDLNLQIEDLFQSKKICDFFKELFNESLATKPSMSKSISHLYVRYILKTENKEVLLQKIEMSMGVEWRKAFDSILSAHG